ncbi:disease resistance protein RPV1-like isoform X2 [Eucalyptus grandis]|uniref:disease resistance protein RPV1-like isoform X2 n=1 Tax=Eucalyptus grandis TaxID=71139 RepID=UPI00192F01FE|nr:disease resistance protein RPV1-like isoform X2 [Eucalyptus grandis]XP_039165082.1 disease resistance protein RPV1-like isoform X2 [Eucalyptus grandis]XP_039165083.1 disease resistance protein RPV1-like isoform X2 [Eucalyptus grandis]XP_039165084.1 disease resistance protein RPV1-like isoform X2 [Eucalyptus grandis]XP_039165085.1 disease resistance protein RPV1-like isoform X2 [Eucalyptus grandis]XP_039165086.1 disease resistance protein RPV1-like isoform X2 [Eucalyptus grandis]XP_03916508
MGGIGKTTLAKIVFNELCLQFDGQCSFIGNIRESSKGNGLVNLQKQLASDISDSRFVENFSNADEGIDSITRRAGSKKVLIVLDDLDKREQLKKLAGNPNNFCFGSRIIITTRDKRILDEEKGILAYEVKEMDCDKALELFSLHAFNGVSPPNAYRSLSREVVSMTGGLPLALEVIGSYLHDQKEEIWKEMLEMLKNVPHDEVRDKLKISYDALGDVEKEIFLDIACFFIFQKKLWAAYFWDACHLYPHKSLKKLTDLCLIKIVDGDTIWMHDQLRDLGRDIVQKECTLSRLWNDKEALEVMRSKERKDKVKALNLGRYNSDPISIVDKELERMPNLKLLKLFRGTFAGDIKNNLRELRWLSWQYPPLDPGMANLHLKNLALFELSNNENTDNWGGWNILKMENKLKVLSLISCDGLKQTLDFSGCVSLKILSLAYCQSLQEVDSSIGKLKDLTHLHIEWCTNLRYLPKEIGGLVNLKHFSICYCPKIKKLPDIGKLASLSQLDISQTIIKSSPDSIGNAKNLSSLDLSGTSIVKLPISIGELMQLEFLSLSKCHNFVELPESIGYLTKLQMLDLSWTKITKLPNSIKNLKQLKVMRMESCPIQRLPASIGMLAGMKELNVRYCEQLAGELPTTIGKLLSLSILDISQTSVCAVPATINSLMQLQELDLSYCKELRELPKLPSSLNCLRVISASLRLVPDLSNLTNLVTLELSNNYGQALAQASTLQLQWVGKLSKLERLKLCLSDIPVPSMELGCLPRLKNLTLPHMDSFDSVVIGPQFSHLKNLSTLHLCRCPLREIQLDGLELVEDLIVTYCEFLERLSVISSNLRKLFGMAVENCPKLLQIRFLSTMEPLVGLEVGYLVGLRVGYCVSLGGLYGLSNLKKLETLRFIMCPELRVIEGLEELELLRHLYITVCPSLKKLTNLSNSKIPNECLVYVTNFDELPYCAGGRYGDYREEILDWTRRGLNQEGAARFFKCGRLLIVQMLKKLEVPYNTIHYYGAVQLKWIGYPSLETLYFHYCLNLRKFDSSIGKMKVLTHLDIIWCTNIRTLPEEIGGLVNLMHFSIKKCSRMEKLPHSIGKLGSLSKLNISSSRITSLPDSIGNAKHLSFLNLSSTPIMELPISIGELTQLELLSLKYCRNLGELPESIGNLTSLQKLNLLGTNIVELPDSIKNLKQLKVMTMGFCPIRRLPASIEMLEKLEELHAEHCEQLAGKLPIEIGKLLSLTIIDISYTQISVVPMAINYLTQLQKLDLTHCNELQELPKLPSSLHCLRVHSASLRLVPDLSNLTNLVEMLLSNGFGQAPVQPSNPMQTFQLQWVGKLSKLEKLNWGLSNFPISSTELGCLPRLRELSLSSMDNFDSIVVGPQFSNLKNLSILCLHSSPLREIQLDGLELLRNLGVRECEFLERLSVISSSLRKVYKMEVLDCPKLLEIQFPNTMESLEELRVGYCDSLEGLHGLSNSKKLKALRIYQCNGLRVVEGLEELELLGFLYLSRCGLLERLTDVSDSKIPNECKIEVLGCMKLSSYEGTYRDYKEMILVRMRMTFNEEDEMEENDRIDCSTGILECICNPLSFFQGRSLRRQTG